VGGTETGRQLGGLRFLGGVLNQTNRAQNASIRTNPQVIQEFVALPRWAVVPYVVAKKTAWKTTGKRIERAGFLEELIRPVTR
jgi:hypothetical protein